MRQGQPQNRRGRGRGARKSTNPLTRSFESNGPDVKIRGTAAHIAEKYVSLARDALVNGDVVQAEGYLQHAEHYNRIILSSQPTHPQGQGDSVNGAGPPRVRTWSLDSDMDDEDDGDDMQDPAYQPQPQVNARDDGQRDGGRREVRDNRDGGQGRDNRDGGQGRDNREGFGRHGGRRHSRSPNGGRDNQPRSYQPQPQDNAGANGSTPGDVDNTAHGANGGNGGTGEKAVPEPAGADNSNPENTNS